MRSSKIRYSFLTHQSKTFKIEEQSGESNNPQGTTILDVSVYSERCKFRGHSSYYALRSHRHEMLSSILPAASAFTTTSGQLRPTRRHFLWCFHRMYQTEEQPCAALPEPQVMVREPAGLRDFQRHQTSETSSRRRDAHLKDFSRSQGFVRQQRSLVPHLLSLQDNMMYKETKADFNILRQKSSTYKCPVKDCDCFRHMNKSESIRFISFSRLLWCTNRSVFDDESGVRQRVSADRGLVCRRVFHGRRSSFLPINKQQQNFSTFHHSSAAWTWALQTSNISGVNELRRTTDLIIKESNVEIHCNGSYLHFRNGRDDGGFGFEVSQIHGPGEQQQWRRNVLLQVQVQPLSVGAQHILLHSPQFILFKRKQIGRTPSLKAESHRDCAHLLHLQTELIGGEAQRSHPPRSTRSL